jgi:hypothetical protein
VRRLALADRGIQEKRESRGLRRSIRNLRGPARRERTQWSVSLRTMSFRATACRPAHPCGLPRSRRANRHVSVLRPWEAGAPGCCHTVRTTAVHLSTPRTCPHCVTWRGRRGRRRIHRLPSDARRRHFSAPEHSAYLRASGEARSCSQWLTRKERGSKRGEGLIAPSGFDLLLAL